MLEQFKNPPTRGPPPPPAPDGTASRAVDVFVAGVSTGSTILASAGAEGATREDRRRRAARRCCGRAPKPRSGHGAGIPDVLAREIVDEVIAVAGRRVPTARRSTREDLAGIGGAAMAAAGRAAAESKARSSSSCSRHRRALRDHRCSPR
jgi:hypothetical protein